MNENQLHEFISSLSVEQKTQLVRSLTTEQNSTLLSILKQKKNSESSTTARGGGLNVPP
jgi:hypothetical protein